MSLSSRITSNAERGPGASYLPGLVSGWRVTGRALALLVLALAAATGGSMPARAAGQEEAAAPEVARRQPTARHQGRGLDDRVRALSKALDLDATQQRQVRLLLERQRERVMEAWSDASVAPALRVAATQAIGDETADRIRALLNEEQKKRFGQPRPAREPAGPSPGVEDWMNRTRPI